MKRRVAEVNTSFKLHDVRKHTIHPLENISKEFWRKCEDHVKSIEDIMYWAKDGLNFSELRHQFNGNIGFRIIWLSVFYLLSM